MSGNASSSRSKQVGDLQGLLSGGAGGGDKPPRHPGRMKSIHELNSAGATRGSKRPAPAIPTAAGGDERGPFRCSSCEHSSITEEDLKCHFRRCHTPRNWRRGKQEVPHFWCSSCEHFSITEEDLNCHIRRCHTPRNWRRGKEQVPQPQPSVESKQAEQQQQQQTDQATAAEEVAEAEALPKPAVEFAFDLNVPGSEVE